ncbi:MerR family DNA-binding protein [Amycolatopsis sp. NPDC004378]
MYLVEVVVVLRFMKHAQELGFTLDEVAELLRPADGGPDGCEPARATAVERVAGPERRIADPERMRASSAELVATCDRSRPDRRCPLLHALQSEPGGAR